MIQTDWRAFHMQLTNDRFSGHSALSWLSAIGLFLVILIALKITLALAHKILDARAQHSPLLLFFTRALQRTSPWILGIIALVVASHRLTLPAPTKAIFADIAASALFAQAALWGSALIRASIDHYRSKTVDGERVTTIVALGFIATILLWMLLTLAALNNLGVNVTALLAGFGVGGVALALAVQTTLADILASLSIMFDKPFVLGDYITIDSFGGTVEYIGLKTTHLRSPSGEQIIMSNSDLIKSRVRNFKRMRERTLTFTIYVTYENTHEKLTRIPMLIESVIKQESRARFMRAHFSDYQPLGLVFDVAYVLQGDYAENYRDVHQDLNLAIFRSFQEQGIEFARQVTAHTPRPPERIV